MAHLARAGAVEPAIDPWEPIADVHEARPAEAGTGEVAPSRFLGEVGIPRVQWRLTPARHPQWLPADPSA